MARSDSIPGFISYCHDDRAWLETGSQQVYSLLRELRRSCPEVTFWYDEELRAGSRFRPEIEARIDSAKIAILLISFRFLASDFIRDIEVPRILGRADAGELVVVPILVGPVFKDKINARVYDQLYTRQIVPAEPLVRYTRAESDWQFTVAGILKDLRAMVERIIEPEQAPPQAQAQAWAAVKPIQANPPLDFRVDPNPRTETIDGIEMVRIPAGVHRHGLDARRIALILEATGLAQSDTSLAPEQIHELPMRELATSRFPITCAQFQRFLDASGYEERAGRRWTDLGQRATLPITNVSWDDAQAFCDYYGFRLPTWMEWEYATSGGDDRVYPWGGHYNPRICNDARQNRGLLPVGTFESNVSRFGVRDMAGNVYQLLDAGLERSGVEGTRLVETVVKLALGGSYMDDGRFSAIPGFTQFVIAPDSREAHIGFRVCRREQTPPRDKPDFVAIPGGAFEAGCSARVAALWARAQGTTVHPDWTTDYPPRRARVASFEITRGLVTNHQYWASIRRTNRRPPPHWWRRPRATGLGDGEEYPFPRWMRDLPVTSVTLEDAEAFAKGLGGYVVSGDEWEYAARGETSRLYPWGDTFDLWRCNTAATRLGRCNEAGEFTGSATPSGVQDLCGNAAELLRGEDASRVEVRGASWTHACERFGAGFFFQEAQRDFSAHWLGFRVARR